ncbi:aminoglycoside phosphotransferase (APT) family kinase protein [Kribbella antiqua]|uniref:Aminoglycoside phosphotransferase (APT) family kinase protein n=1 Tax=Kribbella antiqua TaxID=2512217 RepID=A0A4R2J2X6_9ACTN|nr:aminoglycoside phosphotransferase family protein [Kribbella antiqua]TCO51276.1 aminoglycoside phosphotransferase (APT) family kinase protein [Kribbella antiqua]
MRWLDSPAEVSAALKVVAPDLADAPVVVREPVGGDDPLWRSASAVVGGRFVVKFAWSEPAALRLAHEIAVLRALAIPYLPEVVASSTDPLLLVTRIVPGTALFEVVDSIDRDHAGRQLARFLGELHDPATRKRVEAAVGELAPAALQPATTDLLRDRFDRWARADQRPAIRRWCDWADDVLASPGPSVLVHADLHGGNQVWDGENLRVVVDFETAGLAEPEYDLRCFPGTGPGVELLTATMRHYQDITGRALATDRVMAWHLRTALGDALWRSEAGVHLPDHRTPTEWVDDLAARFSALGIDI